MSRARSRHADKYLELSLYSPPMSEHPDPSASRPRWRRLLTGLLVALATLSIAPSRPAHAADAPSSASSEALEELLVTGERTGPGMWHVHKGSEELWILGSLSPLPKGITWRANEVERRLDHTQLVLVPKPIEIGIVRILWLLITERKVLLLSGSRRLKDVMPPALYARFAAQRARYVSDPTKWEHFRPLIAAALLQRDAFERAGLSARLDLGAAVRKLARDKRIPVQEVKIAGVGDVMDALKTMTPATEDTCVEASLATIERDLPRLKERAAAWATGDVERIESLPEPAEVDACLAALDAGAAEGDLLERIRRSWLGTLQATLHSGKPALAVANMDMLIEKGGLLDRLRAEGYQIDVPAGAAR